jgi:uncharacterized protein with HEPN domain
MREAAEYIVALTEGQSEQSYRTTKPLRQLVERNFEIVGEAMRRLEHHDPATSASFPEAKDLVGFRNALVHGYDGIDHARVWRTISIFLPPLLPRLENLIATIELGET